MKKYLLSIIIATATLCLPLLVSAAGLSVNTVWEIRTATGSSDNNGCDFVAGATGSDYTYGSANTNLPAAAFSGTNLVVDGTTNTKVKSASHNFVAADVGNSINITAGTGWTPGIYQITAIGSNEATLNVSPAAINTTGGTWAEGGACASLGFVSGKYVVPNKIFIKGDGIYSITGSISPSVSGNSSVPIKFIGYSATRGDGGKATIQASSTSGSNYSLLTTSFNYIEIDNLTLDCNNVATTTGIYIGGGGDQILNSKATNCTQPGINAHGTSETLYGDEVSNTASTAVAAVSINSTANLMDSYIHDNNTNGIIQLATDNNAIIGNIIDNNYGATSSGIVEDGNCEIMDNVINRSGQTGIRYGSNYFTIGVLIKNNIITNTGYSTGANATNAYGIMLTSAQGPAANPLTDGNTFYNNKSGDREYMDDTTTNPVNGVAPYTNLYDICQTTGTCANKTLTTDPYTASSTLNYTLNNTTGGGAAIRGKGWPFSFPIAGTGYPDMGVFEHQDPLPTTNVRGGRVKVH